MSKAVFSSLSLIPQTFPVRDLQRRYADILAFVKQGKKPALLVNKSFPEAVIVDVDTYNNLVRDGYEYDEEYVLKMDRKALKAHRAGKTKKLDSLRSLLK